MVLTCSPQQESTNLRFASSSHLQHIDATSTLLQLRRSLSRSPSKSPAPFRLATGKAGSHPASPLSSAHCSPRRGSTRHQVSNLGLPSRVATGTSPSRSPLRHDSSRTALSFEPTGTCKSSPLRAVQRIQGGSRLLQTRRVLGESTDGGNSSPLFTRPGTPDIENNNVAEMTSSKSIVQPTRAVFKGFDQTLNVAPEPLTEQPGMPSSTFNFRAERRSLILDDTVAKSSPRKRPDAPSRTESSETTSPSAKRRSLHGASDLTIFDSSVDNQPNPAKKQSPEPASNAGSVHMAPPAVLLKRTGPFRKSTTQQRHDRPLLNRTKASDNLGSEFTNSTGTSVGATAANSNGQGAARALPTRRTLFGGDNVGSQVSDGTNMAAAASNPAQAAARHPLSRTMTQSSSGSDVAQDSPTHPPLRAPVNRNPFTTFTRSLPLGAEKSLQSLAASSIAAPSSNVTETPANYKHAVPLQTAFHSTGLISKRAKDIRGEQASPAGNMPDTPCKRPMPINPMAPSATPAPPPRHAQLRRNMHAFGSPSTPFNPTSSRPSAGANGKGVGIFGSTMKPLNRRGSFLSADGDEPSQISSASESFEVPSTPSKMPDSLAITSNDQRVPIQSHQSQLPPSIDMSPGQPSQPGSPLMCTDEEIQACEDLAMDMSPSSHRRYASLGHATIRRPSILSDMTANGSRKYLTLPSIRTGRSRSRNGSLSPISPLFNDSKQLSPHTPYNVQDSMAPPDPSGLSISAHRNTVADLRQSQFQGSYFSGPVPATPTANRESRFQSHRLVQSSAHAIAEAQVDPSLTSRFEEVEMIGDGEFSSVFKVTAQRELSGELSGASSVVASYFAAVDGVTAENAGNPKQQRVYAVKKSRNKYLGPKDRLQKLKEVEVLRALGPAAHTIELVDHWEHDTHLYIQTDFCERGSLDRMLIEVGQKARLDDFRIWKILLEVGQGLQHIHGRGFMHLDLKPANILVTADGALKIADFGMATSWPAAPGIEAEGDREYIGPEVLTGAIDKASDIFALGLIVFEIAGNVMLPDNGPNWQRLRQGDISDVPSLTLAPGGSIRRDDAGMPVDDSLFSVEIATPPVSAAPEVQSQALVSPPSFMADRDDACSLENVVTWMISPTPSSRPTVDALLEVHGLVWVRERRRQSATIYEGEWGPGAVAVEADAEMTDA